MAPNNDKPAEFNPHWRGYFFLLLSSLINFAAISDVSRDDTSYVGSKHIAVAFGSLTFCVPFLLLVLDRTWDDFPYTKACDGKLEGSVLLFFTVWWIAGVAYITQVNGIGYVVLNVYVTAWSSLASSVYTLNLWSSKRDLLSIDELTGVSVTLKAWYILFLSSLVVLGTTINAALLDIGNDVDNDDQSNWLAMILGGFSSLLSFIYILLHYRLIECCSYGGWSEFVAALLLIILWVMGCALITQEGAVGSVIIGRGCPGVFADEWTDWAVAIDTLNAQSVKSSSQVCLIELKDANRQELVLNGTLYCEEFLAAVQRDEPALPGSNLYVFVWTCLGASIQIALRWKAQQAVQFAARAQEQEAKKYAEALKDSNRNAESDDDDDLEFMDAAE